MRPIDANELSDGILYLLQSGVTSQDIRRGIKKVYTMLCDTPTIEAEPAKHSHWFYPFSELDINRCWECGMYVQDKINNVRETFKYCPNCGAIMDGGAENETN